MSESYTIPWSRGSKEDPYTEEDIEALDRDDIDVEIPSP
jgi:hypothetical protein